MTATTNGAVAPDDGSAIPADLLVDGEVAAPPSEEERAQRAAEAEKKELRDRIRAQGGKITREPGPVAGGTRVIAFVVDPDGYKIELIQQP